jgi:NADH dehydrogenase
MRVESRAASQPTVCVLGGTGFVGRHLVNRLADEGYHVRVITRHRERHRELLVRSEVELVEGDINDLDILRHYFTDCDAVINLAAILNERRRGDFQAVHVVFPGKIIQACRDRGVKRLLHMSALNADARADTSRYLHSKGQGEKLMQVASKDLDITIFRPSVIFGEGDHFFNRFGLMLNLSPLPFPVVCATTRFAPIYVGDVAQAIVVSLMNPATIGQTYDLCGPRSYSLRELVEFTAETLGIKRLLINCGPLLSTFHARVLGLLPGKLLTYDNVLSMKRDNVCSEAFPAVFAFELSSIEAKVPMYLGRENIRGRYYEMRRFASRSD